MFSITFMTESGSVGITLSATMASGSDPISDTYTRSLERSLFSNAIVGARPSFRHVRARSFQASGAALPDKIEIEPHALNVGSVERIAVNAPKALTDGGGGQSRRGLPVVLRGKHVPQRDVGIALHAEHAFH